MILFDFGRLREMRKRNLMSQQEAAERMHCTASCISRWELGKTPITADDLAALIEVYNDENWQDYFVTTF